MADPFGGFTEEALAAYQKALAEQDGTDFAEGDSYDFTTCIRPDGSSYGTGGKCRKGTEGEAKAKENKGGMRDRALTPKEQASIDAKLGRTPGPSKVAEGLQREQMRADRAARTKAQFNKQEMENPKNQADMDHAGLMRLMANSPTAQRKLREEAARKGKS
jgi:hypothetical protein